MRIEMNRRTYFLYRHEGQAPAEFIDMRFDVKYINIIVVMQT